MNLISYDIKISSKRDDSGLWYLRAVVTDNSPRQTVQHIAFESEKFVHEDEQAHQTSILLGTVGCELTRRQESKIQEMQP